MTAHSKRKRGGEDLGPHTRPHLGSPGKHLFHPLNVKRVKTSTGIRTVPQEKDMSELVLYILEHEEAFQSPGRVASLFSDFRSQLDTNPEGYHTNVAIWVKALSAAAREGLIPTPGGTRDLFTIHTGHELVRALHHKDYGTPTCLPAIFREAVKKGDFIPRKTFLSAQTSIYHKSWIPTISTVLRWTWEKFVAPPDPQKLVVGDFVVVKNVEEAAEEILNMMNRKAQVSTTDRIMSRKEFLRNFAMTLNPVVPLTANDLEVLLVHLHRDKQALSFNAQTVKFKAPTEEEPLPVTEDDTSIAALKDSLDKINATLLPLEAKIAEHEVAAREAVQAKKMHQAKTALRQKKLAESALTHRNGVALQLQEMFLKVQEAADHVEVVQAMQAGAKVMSSLHQKVGGVEGVQTVMDAVNEEMSTVDEITTIINESATPVDEGEIDDEFEALEKAEKEKEEKEEAEKTAVRLAELEKLDKERKETERKEKEKEDEQAEEKVEQTSEDLSKLSFSQERDSGKQKEQEERVPVAA